MPRRKRPRNRQHPSARQGTRTVDCGRRDFLVHYPGESGRWDAGVGLIAGAAALANHYLPEGARHWKGSEAEIGECRISIGHQRRFRRATAKGSIYRLSLRKTGQHAQDYGSGSSATVCDEVR